MPPPPAIQRLLAITDIPFIAFRQEEISSPQSFDKYIGSAEHEHGGAIKGAFRLRTPASLRQTALVFPPGGQRGPAEQPDPASKAFSDKVPPRKGSTNPSISKGTSSAQRQELVDLDPHPKAFGDRREPQHHFPRVMDQAPRRMQEQKAQPLGTCRQHLGGQRQPL